MSEIKSKRQKIVLNIDCFMIESAPLPRIGASPLTYNLSSISMKHLYLATICLWLCLVSGISRADSVVYWNTEAAEERVATSGLNFTLQEDAWLPLDENDEESPWVTPYQPDFSADSVESEFPEIQKLELFELLGYGGAVDVQLPTAQVWGVVTNDTGTVLGAAAAEAPVLNTAEAFAPLTFDFSESVVVLETGVSYTMHFICSDSPLDEQGIAVGGAFSSALSDEIYIHLSQIVVEEDGWEFAYNTNANLYYIDSIECNIAPAVYIATIAADVPEPVSSTLSLLALCGMLTRRRRR